MRHMNIMKKSNIFVGSAILFICLLGSIFWYLSNSKNGKDKDTFKIGMIISKDNVLQNHDRGIKTGIEYALKQEKNNPNGIDSKIMLLSSDADSINTKTKKQLQHMIEEKNVKVVIGSSDYNLCNLEKQIANEYNIPIIVPRNIAVNGTENPNRVHEQLPSVKQESQFLVSFIKSALKAQKVTVIYELSSEYQQSFAQNILKSAEKNKILVVSTNAFVADTKNYGPILSKAMSENPDVIVIAAYPSEAGYIIDQAREKGITIPIVGPSSLDRYKSLRKNIKLKNLDNIYYCSLSNLNSDDFIKFAKTFKEMKEYNPSKYELYGYNVGLELVSALKRSSINKINADEFDKALSQSILQFQAHPQLFLKKIESGNEITEPFTYSDDL